MPDSDGIVIHFVRAEWQARGGVHVHQLLWQEIDENEDEQGEQMEVQLIEDGEDGNDPENERDENEGNRIELVDNFEDESEEPLAGYGSEEEAEDVD